MGLFSSLVGSPQTLHLMRKIGFYRFGVGPAPHEKGSPGDYFSKASRSQLLALPEGTVVTIAESYVDLLKGATKPDDALRKIEAHRRRIGEGELPYPLTLESYIEYRLSIEHSNAGGINASWLRLAVGACRHQLNIYEEAPGIPRQTRSLLMPVDYDDLPDLKAAALKQSPPPSPPRSPTSVEDEKSVFDALSEYLDGEITDEEFFERVGEPMLRINRRRGRAT